MKKLLFSLLAMAAAIAAAEAKTLVVFYSFSNNTRTIVGDLKSQLADADIIEVEPAEEGLDYAANGYAIGCALMSAIRNNPDSEASYPAIKNVDVNFSAYSEVVVATPLWYAGMAAPMQTFLFKNGNKMNGKKTGLIVSSASSGISGVESDAKRLVPGGNFVSSLWIRSYQTSSCHSMISDWLASTGIGSASGVSSLEQSEIRLEGGQLVAYGNTDGIQVFDAMGRFMATSSTNHIDVSRMPRGVYVARIISDSNASTFRFVIR